MNNGKPTPGPWFVDCEKGEYGEILIRDKNDWPLARIVCLRPNNNRFDFEADANARLIAATPDMKAALADLIEIAHVAMIEGNDAGAEWDVEGRLKDARAALAKAEGKE